MDIQSIIFIVGLVVLLVTLCIVLTRSEGYLNPPAESSDWLWMIQASDVVFKFAESNPPPTLPITRSSFAPAFNHSVMVLGISTNEVNLTREFGFTPPPINNITKDKVGPWLDGFNNMINNYYNLEVNNVGYVNIDTRMKLMAFAYSPGNSYNTRWRLEKNLDYLVKNRRLTLAEKNSVKTSRGGPNLPGIRNVLSKIPSEINIKIAPRSVPLNRIGRG